MLESVKFQSQGSIHETLDHFSKYGMCLHITCFVFYVACFLFYMACFLVLTICQSQSKKSSCLSAVGVFTWTCFFWSSVWSSSWLTTWLARWYISIRASVSGRKSADSEVDWLFQ